VPGLSMLRLQNRAPRALPLAVLKSSSVRALFSAWSQQPVITKALRAPFVHSQPLQAPSAFSAIPGTER